MLAAAASWGMGVFRLRQHRVSNPKLSTTQLMGWTGAGILLLLGLGSFVDYPLRVPSLAALAAIAAVWMGWAVTESRPNTVGGSGARHKPLGAHSKPEN